MSANSFDKIQSFYTIDVIRNVLRRKDTRLGKIGEP